MTTQRFNISFSFTVLIIQIILIAWQLKNNQVAEYSFSFEHYRLTITNWWNLVLLPVTAYICLQHSHKRILKAKKHKQAGENTLRLIGFILSFNFGATMAGCNYLNMEFYSLFMLACLFVISIKINVVRAECLMGFVLSMSVIYGAVISMLYALAIAILCYLINRIAVRLTELKPSQFAP